MRLDLLKYLCCPLDGCEHLQLEDGLASEEGVVVEGTLRCQACRERFPVIDGIPCLLPPEMRDESVDEADEYALKEMRLRDAETAVYEDLFTAFQNMVELPLFARHLRLMPQDVVLDLGCGTGRLTRALYRSAGRVIAVDLAREPLLALRESLQPPGLAKVDVVQASAAKLPLRQRSVDAVASAQVLTHIPQGRAEVLDCVAAVLRPGGLFACTVHNLSRRLQEQWPTGERTGDSVFMKFFRPPELTAELGESLRVERVFPIACREGRLPEKDWLGLLLERGLERTGLGLPTARLLFAVASAPPGPGLPVLQVAGPDDEIDQASKYYR